MKQISLEDFGGKNDGAFDNTDAFSKAFTELAQNGGGTLTVHAGVWCTGPVTLFSNTTLVLEEGAELSFIPNPERYTPVYTRWEGVECYAMHPLIYASGQKNVKITGKGLVNGNGETWWKLRNEKKKTQTEPTAPYEIALAKLNPNYKNQPGGGGGREFQFLRPSFIEFINCENVILEGITIKNSPFWTVHPLYTKNLLLKDLCIENPKDAPNTDGIDIDSSEDVKVLGCKVSVGDDGICIKSGSGADGIRVNKPTRNVEIRDCKVQWSHGGIVIGSETAAPISHIVAENCDLSGTDRGIRIKSRRGRGGDISDVQLKNLDMSDTLCPIAINMYYKCGEKDPTSPLFSLDAQPVTAETPRIHDITISGIKATGCKASAGFIVGLPESPITGLRISDCVLSTDESSTESPMDSDMFFGLPEVTVKSFRVRNTPDAKFENVTITGPKETFIYN
ncbi:MAG: glycoside hydrolase family 28 protein [Treponema sp.]|nr:glycoside hydrolase family 28 protein [Treponema sp.]